MRPTFAGGKGRAINFKFLMEVSWSLNLHVCQDLCLIFIFALKQAGAPKARPLKLTAPLLPLVKAVRFEN